MAVKLRRVIIAARFRGPCPEQATARNPGRPRSLGRRRDLINKHCETRGIMPTGRLSLSATQPEFWNPTGQMTAELLPGNGEEVRFNVIPTVASSPRQVFKVAWNDDSGDRENCTTLRSPL
jgi:hypothetical protein